MRYLKMKANFFAIYFFLQKCMSYSEELQQALLTMSYICCKPNNDLWLYGSWFLFSSPELENFAFYKPSQPQLKKLSFQNYMNWEMLSWVSFSEFNQLGQLITVASIDTELQLIFHPIFHMCQSVMFDLRGTIMWL